MTPVFVWAIQDDDRRRRFSLEFFTLYAKAFLRHDETYTTGGEVVARSCRRADADPGKQRLNRTGPNIRICRDLRSHGRIEHRAFSASSILAQRRMTTGLRGNWVSVPRTLLAVGER